MAAGIRAMASRAAPIQTPTGGQSAVAVAAASLRAMASLPGTSSAPRKRSGLLRDNGLLKENLPQPAQMGAAAMAPRWPGSKRAPAAAKTV